MTGQHIENIGPIEAAIRSRATAAHVRLFFTPTPPPMPRRPRPVSPFLRELRAEQEATRAIRRAAHLEAMVRLRDAEPQWLVILREVARAHGIRADDIIGSGRIRKVVLARHEAAWRMRTEIVLRGEPMSFPEIGRRLGGRDHTSALHGFRMHEKRLREAQQS